MVRRLMFLALAVALANADEVMERSLQDQALLNSLDNNRKRVHFYCNFILCTSWPKNLVYILFSGV